MVYRHGNSVHCTIIHKAFVNCISTKKGSLTRLRDLNLTDNNAAQESKLVLLPLFRFVLFFSSPLAFGWFDHVFPGGWKKALTMKTSLKTWPHQNKNLSRNNLQDIYVIHFQWSKKGGEEMKVVDIPKHIKNSKQIHIWWVCYLQSKKYIVLTYFVCT